MAFTHDKTKINWRTFWICFLLAFGSFSYGYAASIISTTLGQPSFQQYMHLADAEGNPAPNAAALTGATVGLFCAGGCIGVLVCSWAMDSLGRRRAMMVWAIIHIVGDILVTAAVNIAMFIAGRTIVGFSGVGFIAMTASYVAELSQAETRGFFTGLTGAAIAVGYTVAAYMGLAFFYAKEPAVQWRAPLAISMLGPIILLVALCFTPESPRYLLLQGKPDQAWKVLSYIHHDPTDQDGIYVKEEFFQMQKQIEFDSTLDSSWIQLFRKPSYRKRILMASLVQFLAQSTAVLVAAAYGPSLYAALGFNTRDSIILQCGWITTSIPAAVIGAKYCDKFGRKIFIMAGLLGALVSLSILTAIEAVFVPAGTNKVALGWAVAALYLIVIFYCLGVESVGAAFYCEIFPTHIRAKGVCFAFFVNSAVNVLYLEVAPVALQTIKWKFLLIFICALTVGSVVYWIWVPETKGVPLEELAAIFGDTDDVKVFSEDIHIDATKEVVFEDHRHNGGEEGEDIKSQVLLQEKAV